MKITEGVVAWFGGVVLGLNAMLFIFPEEMGEVALGLLVLGLFSVIGATFMMAIAELLCALKLLDL